jgi:exosortase
MQKLGIAIHSNKSGTGLDGQALSEARNGLGLLSQTLPWRPGQRNVLVLLSFLGVCAWFFEPLMKLFALASENEQFSHVFLIPALVFYLLFLNRTTILTCPSWSPTLGTLVMAAGSGCYWLADGQDGTQDSLTAAVSAFVVTCWGLFLLSYGARCFQENLFGLAMLLFLVPLPTILLDPAIRVLQRGSAEATDVLFSALGVPVFREGFVFSLSDFTIYVAEECSGIRSALALFITSLMAGHLFLRTTWGRLGVVSIVVPLAIVKNAVRIVGLALLANYVDPTFITDSALHRNGGIPLFVLSLAVLFSAVWLVRKLERRFPHDASRAQT